MVYPRCKSDQIQVYISADGLVVPCCWIGSEPHVDSYRKLHQGYLDELNIRFRSLDEILADPRFLKVEKTWSSGEPFSGCNRFCSKPLDLTENVQAKGMSQKCRIDLRP